MKDKATEAAIEKPQLSKIFEGDNFSNLMSGYANTEAFGGHNKAYDNTTDIPKDLLRIVKKYLNPNLPN
ncbi:MAG: hypothetical protein GY874_08295 [Desulfobacteraceae bacterium]|nr:hypothetical protein [Desulfobacteraceae bacterium]